jgi:hypothetical protein
MKKNVFMYLAVTALLVSCSKVEVVEPASDAVPVELSGVLNTGAGTRGDGVIESTPAPGNLPTEDLTLSIFRADQPYGTAYNDPIGGTFTKDGAINMSPAQYYLVDANKKSRFIAVYPNSDNFVYTKADRTLAYTIDGSTDIIASQVAEGGKGDAIEPLIFNHLLTQIRVKLVVNDVDAQNDPLTEEQKNGISAQWGKITAITLADKAGTATVTLPNLTVSEGSEGAVVNPLTDITLSNEDVLPLTTTHGQTDGYTLTATETEYGYAMFLPIGTDTPLTLDIKYADGTGTAHATTVAQSFDAGKAYEIILKFNLDGTVIDGGGTDGTGARLIGWVPDTTTPNIPVNP